MLRAHGIAVRVAAARRRAATCRTTSPPRWPIGAASRGRCTPGCALDRLLPDLARAWLRGTGHRQRVHGGGHGVPAQSRGRARCRTSSSSFVAAPMTAQALLRAVRAALSGRFRHSRGGAAAGEPGHIWRSPRPTRARRRASCRISSLPNAIGRRSGPGCAWRARSAGRRRCGPSWRRRSRRVRRTGPTRRSTRISAATGISVHHPLGTCRMGARSGGGRRGRWRTARPRRRAAARGRCLGDARPGRRQHQRAGDHDRREGRRPDPRPSAAAARRGVMPARARHDVILARNT